MTSDEFFTALEESKEQGFVWHYKKMSTTGEFLIRASKQMNGTQTFCPLTVVTYMKTGEVLTITQWEQCIRLLELDELYGAKIMRAADRSTALPADIWTLRDDMIEATGVAINTEHRDQLLRVAVSLVNKARLDLGEDLMDSSGVDLLLDNMPNLSTDEAIDIWEEVR